MTKEIENSISNIGFVLSEIKGTIKGEPLNSREHIAVATSLNMVVAELNRLYEIEKQMKEQEEIKKEVE